eukprot:Skav208832  [mRNA]  locus=scaffold1193:44122:48009:- [translate_table: standard]
MESAAQNKCREAGKSIPAAFLGRANTYEVCWIPEYSSPPKKGRTCDPQPEFHGINPQHARWLKQLRRLQSFAHRPSTEPVDANQRVKVWDSIANASGFHPDFPRWWTAHSGQPWSHRPLSPTDASLMADVFEQHLRSMEKQLMGDRIQKAKARRVEDPSVIFRDLKQDAALPVQILVEGCHDQVESVEEDERAVVLQGNHPWSDQLPVVSEGVSRNVVHATQDKIWLDNVEGLQVGSHVVQETYISEITKLFQSFQQEWQQRWDRHLYTEDTFWEPILDFARTHLPRPGPMQLEPLTYEAWITTLKRKSKRSATGPDGIARQDLLRMPRALGEQLVSLLNRVEGGEPWPCQCLTGFVVSLEKVAGATSVQQYRPITVLSLIYRTWGSWRARQILKHLAPVSPHSCTGNLPERSAPQTWYGILQSIEMSQMTQGSLSGGVIDLVKAFNHLPRLVILEVMLILNVHPVLVRTWSRALASIERRFQIRSCTGPAVRSTTGCPEGDALSVCGMLCLNLLLHRWVTLRYPSITLYSYVDNIEVVGDSGADVIAGMQGLHQFCDLVDMAIDTNKSYVWSISAAARKELKVTPYSTRLWARDLGGHIQYCKVPTNSTITQRCGALGPLWSRLARSVAPYRQKVLALRQKAWPQSLHGVSSVHLADGHFTTMRTGAMKGLGEYKPGVSLIAHLGMIEQPESDPQFYALLTTALMFRDMHATADHAAYVLQELTHRYHTSAYQPGPTNVLLQRLYQIAWSWSHGTVFSDHQGLPIDLLFCPVQELRVRLVEGWHNRVQNLLTHRGTFEGIQYAHAGLTVRPVRKLELEDQAILRKCLNGAFLTADHLQHREVPQPTTCKFCNAPDSQLHRHWECPYFQDCREVPAERCHEVVAISQCLANHGWVPEPPSLCLFRTQCLQIPVESSHHVWPPWPVDEIFAFTDGSCLSPTVPEARLASWGVVMGDPAGNFWALSNGLLPGWIQTVIRAEIFAVISACEAAMLQQCPLRLWVDNDLLYRRLLRAQQGTLQLQRNAKDADLWNQLQQVVSALGDMLLSVTKVCSHQNLDQAADAYEEWVFRGNCAADYAAAQAFSRFPSILQAQQQLAIDLQTVETLRKAVHTTMIRIGRKAIQAQNPVSVQSDVPHQASFAQDHLVIIPRINAMDIPPKYCFHGMNVLLNWLADITHEDAAVVRVSWYQLNAAYEHMTGQQGVRHNKKTKQWEAPARGRQVNFVKRCNFFSAYVRAVLGMFGPPVGTYHLRPHGVAINFWCYTIALRLKPTVLTLADDVLMKDQPSFKTVAQLRAR